MEFMRRFFAAMGFDCSRQTKFTAQSSSAEVMVNAGRKDSNLQNCSLSQDPDLPHCQGCISYEARLHRLVCGHLYCDHCRSRIVNCAFKDIEGLSEYPCPMCNTIRQMGGTVPETKFPSNQPTVPEALNHCSSSRIHSSVLMKVISEDEEEVSVT
ncbi:hypothetical protein UPYG_G00337210 [Umbra pygmaea]|uniref:RING-type domain-containing protein n=1 Tax=Umbra pygmaea TaxID=75934 RepID=A0ABD0WDD0_UMBPY